MYEITVFQDDKSQNMVIRQQDSTRLHTQKDKMCVFVQTERAEMWGEAFKYCIFEVIAVWLPCPSASTTQLLPRLNV